MRRLVLAALAALIAAGCRNVSTDGVTSESEAPRLPTGARLDPAGRITDVGSFPLAMVASPDGGRLVLLLNGYRDQGVEIIDRASGLVTQTLVQPAAFIGLVFSPDGKHLYASGGNEDAIYAYDWSDARATAADTLILAQKKPKEDGRRYPAGIGISPDGSTLYVAENLGDSLAVVDIATKRVTQRLATDRYPYGVAVSAEGIIYVSAWGGSTVSVFAPSGKSLVAATRIPVARHPSALLLNAEGSRLFAVSASTDAISVVDTRAEQTIAITVRRQGRQPPSGDIDPRGGT
ncbi:MAG: SMP-30/gluconolactonase/LRE family protein, partial [Gemmatimonadales bacterium]